MRYIMMAIIKPSEVKSVSIPAKHQSLTHYEWNDIHFLVLRVGEHESVRLSSNVREAELQFYGWLETHFVDRELMSSL
jgi:hypothetical protein